MPLILRVDVDKPYGHSSLINKAKSKFSEDFWHPKCKLFRSKYLSHLVEFVEFCNAERLAGYFYFRQCTLPDDNVKLLLKQGGHKSGIHLENSRSYETFCKELSSFIDDESIQYDSFTKHGSGNLKLGRYHYPLYEEDKYLRWSKKINCQFNFGNGVSESIDDFQNIIDNFFPKMFWLEDDYRSDSFSTLEDLILCAKSNIVPVLIHPCNYITSEKVRNDFKELVRLSKSNNIEWILL